MPFFSFRFDLSILPLSAPPSLPASRRRAVPPRLFKIFLRFPPLLTAHYCLITAKSSSTLTTFPSKYANPNIVGYTSTPDEVAKNTFTLARVPFTGIGSTSIKLVDAVTCDAAPGSYDTMDAQAPQLQVWNGQSYDKYYYINDAGDSMNETGWADGFGYISTAVYAPGTGFWYKAPSVASSFTMPGEVVSADTVTKDIPAGIFSLMGSPYPMAFSFDKMLTALTPGGYDSRDTQAPQIQVWNGQSYDKYYYINDAGDNMDETGWADGFGYIKEGEVCDSVNGMWIKAPTAGTVTFEK